MLILVEVHVVHQMVRRIFLDVELRRSRDRSEGLSKRDGEGKDVRVAGSSQDAFALQRSLSVLIREKTRRMIEKRTGHTKTLGFSFCATNCADLATIIGRNWDGETERDFAALVRAVTISA